MTAVDDRRAPAGAEGLTSAEAERRLAERGPIEPPGSSRSYASIVRANVLTVFNLILAVFGGLMLAFGSWQDALFLGVLVANSLIGITQEVRAKRALDRLSALVVPTATVLRDGEPLHLPREEVVVGDLVLLQPGDQLVADGQLETAEGLLLDESILTGESDSVGHKPGDELRSGAFVAEGTGRYTVTAVGDASYAARVTGEARRFRHPRSPLERSMNRLLYLLVGAMIPLGALLGYALWERQAPAPRGGHHRSRGRRDPGARGADPARQPDLRALRRAHGAPGGADAAAERARVPRVGGRPLPRQDGDADRGATAGHGDRARRRRRGRPRVRPGRLRGERGRPEHDAARDRRPVSVRAARARAGGAVLLAAALERHPCRGRTYVLGAPELLPVGGLVARAEEEATAGRRVLALARTRAPFEEAEGDLDRHLPAGLEPLGLVVLAERLRAHARETVEFFHAQGVRLKVLSGDRPETVAAIAADVGIPVGDGAVDGRSLPEDKTALQRLLRERNVIGRISPDDKRRVIEALRDDGHYVAMVGDGVNDVPGLKAARLAIAQGSGVQMARSVSDLVLVRSDFEVVPALVAEGRRILRNLQRVTKLFVSKAAFAAFLILSIGITPTAYPLLPRHLTLGASLAIGIPAFFLALAPSAGPFRLQGFLRGVFNFAVPAGAAVGFGVLSSYLAALEVFDLDLVEARTVATTVMVVVGWYLIVALEGTGLRRGAAVTMLCLALAAAYVAVLLVPFARDFFALAPPSLPILLIAAGGCLVAIGGLVLTSDAFIPGRGAALSP